MASDDGLTQVWGQLASLFTTKREEFFDIIRRQGLTPPHGFALVSILEGPVRMRDMADHMNCDASYITAIVDRLETTGLAVRQSDASDRRVKVIALTAKGRRVATELRTTLSAPPPAFEELSPADRKALARILAKIVPADAGSPFRPRVQR